MSNTLTNQVALVTGGAQGLGQAICLRLANEGCDVAVADIKLEQAQATADLIVTGDRPARPGDHDGRHRRDLSPGRIRPDGQ